MAEIISEYETKLQIHFVGCDCEERGHVWCPEISTRGIRGFGFDSFMDILRVLEDRSEPDQID